MKRQIFGIAFTFLYLVAMLRPLLPIIIYYANYDYIANELCINKDKPYLECNGRCYVNAAMERIFPKGTKNKPVSSLPFSMQDYPVSTLDFYKYKSPIPDETIFSANPDFHKHFVINKYSSTIFKPPRLFS